MVTQLQESLENYKKELSEYTRWAHEIKLAHGWKEGDQVDPISFTLAAHNQLVRFTHRLRAMEEILQLTPSEIQQIEKSINETN